MTFGTELATLRKMSHVSQDKLAELSDLDHSFISRLETGTRKPSRDTVERISAALELDAGNRDVLLQSAEFLPASAFGLLSCPNLATLDNIHNDADPHMRAWIEGMVRATIEGAIR